jgi:predicted NACHT family NTPase
MDRTQLFDSLSNLPTAAFDRLLLAVNMPRMNRAGTSAKIGDQVSALLEWADSPVGPGLEAIARHLAELNHFEFDAYLRSLVGTYEKWWEHYTLTDAIGKVESPTLEKPSAFDFGLMVQTVTKEREPTDPENTPLQQDQEKTERLPVLEGIRKYADDHVLLVGRPGSGKSTALIRLLLEEATLSPSPSPKLGRGGQERIPVLVELRYWQTSVLELNG